uniref:Uncharacterized protein n=1 Tax=Rhizophora mucronata TaxID=61149 RepID=A0A2P2N7B4_RHIMU
MPCKMIMQSKDLFWKYFRIVDGRCSHRVNKTFHQLEQQELMEILIFPSESHYSIIDYGIVPKVYLLT